MFLLIYKYDLGSGWLVFIIFIDLEYIVELDDYFYKFVKRIEVCFKKVNLYLGYVFDDGLQDKKIDYDISIACFNSTYGVGNGYLLPAGPLREKLEILNLIMTEKSF